MSHEPNDISLECPKCGASIGYDDVEVVDGHDDMVGCPECHQASPTDDWFE